MCKFAELRRHAGSRRSGVSCALRACALAAALASAGIAPAIAQQASGTGADNTGTDQMDMAGFNETEYDFDLQWRPKGGKWKGTWLRVRYAHVDQRGGGDPTVDDFRVILNYDF